MDLFCLYQVFKASSLALADANVLQDKQFQLIRFFLTLSLLSLTSLVCDRDNKLMYKTTALSSCMSLREDHFYTLNN